MENPCSQGQSIRHDLESKMKVENYSASVRNDAAGVKVMRNDAMCMKKYSPCLSAYTKFSVTRTIGGKYI